MFILAAAWLWPAARGLEAQTITYSVDTTFNTAYNPSELCYNSVRRKVYCSTSDTVLAVIDAGLNYSHIMAWWPSHLEYNSANDRVYVACGSSLYIYNGLTNAQDTVLVLSEGYNDLEYVPATDRMYVAGMGVKILDGASDSVLASHQGNFDGRLFRYRPTNQVLAGHAWADSILFISGTSFTDSVRVPGMTSESRFAANEARGKIYVSLQGINQVAILDASSHAVLRTVGVAAGPQAMAYSPVSDEIYVACHYSDSLTVIRGSDDSVSTVYLGAAGDSTTSVLYNQFVQRIYCADENSGTVAIVNPLTKAVEGTVSLGPLGGPRPVALIEGDSGRVFTANSWNSTISVVGWSEDTRPYIMWTDPPSGATAVRFDRPVSVYFSEAIDPASLAFTCSPDPGGWAAQWDADHRLLTLGHGYFQQPGMPHTFTVTQARDPWGNNLMDTVGAAPNPWTFWVKGLDTAQCQWTGRRYQLVSLPLQPYDSTATGTLGDDLGAYGPSGWRLFGYDPVSTSYVETPPLKLGQGYWLSSVNTATLDAVGFQLPNQGSSLTMRLGQGWNLIGCPFAVPIRAGSCEVMGAAVYSWSDTLSNGLLRQIARIYYDSTMDYVNDGRWDRDSLSPLIDGDSLRPWAGYAVYATQPCSLLAITPISRDQLPAGARPAPAAIDWSLEVTAQAGGISDRVRIGVSPQASPAYDRLDGEKPPPLTEDIKLYLPHADWGPGSWHQYASDFMPAGDHLEWPLALELADQSREAVLNFDLEGRLPDGQRLFLVERKNLRAMEITDQGRAGFTGSRELAVVLSDRGIGGLNLKPLAFELGTPRPNPSVQITRVNYQITKAGLAKLTVYNALGQKLRTIAEGPKEPGYYIASWDGRDDRTALAPPGVYFLKLEAEGGQAVRKLVRVR
jgi:DNA-binding beta-propeller fold protein YncE